MKSPILWSSNAPWTTSGYGNQTALVTERLKNRLGYEVAINCFFGLEGGALDWNGIPCYPTDVSRFGNVMLGEYAGHFGEGDRTKPLCMTLMDVWVLNQGLPNFKGLRFACWTPIDHDPAPPLVTDFLRNSEARVIAMSRFGEKALQDQGFDPMYVPHAIPTDVFKPDPANKQSYREGLAVPKDAFVVGMVAANQGLPSRKSFPQVFEAFAEFQRRHNDAVLFIHADVLGRNNGVNLVALANACGIPTSAMATSNQTLMHLGVPREVVPGIFNSFDVLCMPSFGEGFGIPLMEAQACGIPVITTDFTAMTEMCGSGWLVEGDRWYDATQGSFFKVPHVGSILDALEEAYNHAGDETVTAKSREHALEYDVDKVFDEQWVPVMEALEQPLEIPPLRELVAA